MAFTLDQYGSIIQSCSDEQVRALSSIFERGEIMKPENEYKYILDAALLVGACLLFLWLVA